MFKLILLVILLLGVHHPLFAQESPRADLTPLHIFQEKSDLVMRVRFSPDGKLLTAATSAQETIVWDTISRRVLVTLVSPKPAGITFVNGTSFSKDGKLLATAQRDKVVEIRDTQTWQTLHRFSSDDYSFAVAFRPNQTQLAVGVLRLMTLRQ